MLWAKTYCIRFAHFDYTKSKALQGKVSEILTNANLLVMFVIRVKHFNIQLYIIYIISLFLNILLKYVILGCLVISFV